MADAKLGVVVTTKGAKRASNELNGLAKNAKKTETNVIRAEKRFKSFGKNAGAAIAAVDGPLGGISSRISSLTTLATTGGLAITALAVGVSLLGVGLVMGVRELDKLNVGLAKSEALIKATGGAAGFTSTQLQEQAQALARATLANTEGIQKAQGILQTFDKVSSSTFTRAIVLAQDLAAVYGGDAASQATQLGKALQSPITGITALNRVGVTFSDTQKEQIRLFVEGGEVAKAQEIILSNLASQVGGAGSAGGEGTLAFAFDSAGQSYTELVAALAGSSGAYSGVISLVNILNKGLLVSAQLADENSDRNFQSLIAKRIELQKYIKEINDGTGGSVFTFFGGDGQVDLIGATRDLKEIESQITRIQDANIAKSKDETAKAEKGEIKQEEIRKRDLASSNKAITEKAAKEKAVSDAKTQRQKDAAQKELEVILNLNNTELQAIDTKEAARITKAADSYAQQLISFQDFLTAKAAIELNADTARLAIAQKNDAEALKRKDDALASVKSVSDGFVDAAASGADMGDLLKTTMRGIATSVIKSGIDILVNQLLVDKVASAASAASTTAQVASTVAMASLNSFASTLLLPGGALLAPEAAAAAGTAAAGLGTAVIAPLAAREQGGSLSAGQSSTVAERGNLEILTPSSSSRIRTKQQMQQLMGGDSGGSSSINIVNIDQSSSGVSIESSVDDDGRIIQLIRDTTAVDAGNPNSQLRKTFAASTTLEARR